MPLRDHFRPPLDDISSWEELHGGWPMVIVQQLHKHLPEGYVAGPRVYLGSQIEIDIAAFEQDDVPRFSRPTEEGGGVATAVWAPARPSLAVETTVPDFDEYEVRIYDAKRGRHLVAAIEIVSPANKDRPESRNAFVGKCAALLQKGVAVSIVDLVTTRRFNLYAQLMEFVGNPDPTMTVEEPSTYAASCRWLTKETRARLEAWSYPMTVGQPLPTLPLWLAEALVIPLNLEQSYEQACHDLWIK